MRTKLPWSEEEDSLIRKGVFYDEFIQATGKNVSRAAYYRRRDAIGYKVLPLRPEQLDWLKAYKGMTMYDDFRKAFPSSHITSWQALRARANKCGYKLPQTRGGKRYSTVAQRIWMRENAPYMTLQELIDKGAEIFGYRYESESSAIQRALKGIAICSKAKGRRYAKGIAVTVPEGMSLLCIDGDRTNLNSDNVRFIPEAIYPRVYRYVGKVTADTMDLIIEWAKLKTCLWNAKHAKK